MHARRKEQEGSPSERAPLQQAAQQQADELIEQGRQAHKQALHAAFWATPLWFFAQYAFNASLALTSVTSNTILSSTSSLFTFGLAVVMLGECFAARKLACTLSRASLQVSWAPHVHHHLYLSILGTPSAALYHTQAGLHRHAHLYTYPGHFMHPHMHSD
ncbi:hypothetical protein DUNSADRAFT_8894, partial [Dunaliella salina]